MTIESENVAESRLCKYKQGQASASQEREILDRRSFTENKSQIQGRTSKILNFQQNFMMGTSEKTSRPNLLTTLTLRNELE